jgi:hypothetical protein
MKLWQLGLIMIGVWTAAYNAAHGRTGMMFFMAVAWFIFTVIMAARDE